jgi:hypothetical protein
MTNVKSSQPTKKHSNRKKHNQPSLIPLEPQILLAYEFYNEFKVNYLLDNNLIRALMRQIIKTRKEIVATEADVDRALAAVDTNHDNKINFDQFIKFMQLFFATNNTLKERLERVIDYILGTERTRDGGYLKPQEVSDIDNFFHKFYGKKPEYNMITKSANKNKIEYSAYLRYLEKEFRGCTFVNVVA